MRFNELREALQLRLSGELTRFTDDELKAVVGLLSGPGVVWELNFGVGCCSSRDASTLTRRP